MTQYALTRRRFALGSSAVLTSLLTAFPNARLVGAQAGATHDLIDLGPFETTVPSDRGFAINGNSRIGGINASGDLCGRFAVSEERFSPAIWPVAGSMRRLKSATLGGEARAINADGVVVGRQQYAVDGGYLTRPAVWRDGEPTNLPGLLFGDDGVARDINDDGVIVGGVGTPVIGARWIDDEVEELPNPDGAIGFAPWRINNAGTIFGVVVLESADDPRQVAFLRGDEYELITLPDDVQGYLSVNGTTAIGMSENEIAVVTVGFDSTIYPVRIEDGESTQIAPPSDDMNLSLWDINDAGDAIGHYWPKADGLATGDAAAVLHRNGELLDLNTLVAETVDLRIHEALAINDAGMIAGHAIGPNGLTHGVVLVPLE